MVGGGDKDRGNGTGTWDALQGNNSVGVVIWEQELGCDGGHDKINIGITSSGSHTYFGDDGAVDDYQIVGVDLGV